MEMEKTKIKTNKMMTKDKEDKEEEEEDKE